jgi:hypothetical protein
MKIRVNPWERTRVSEFALRFANFKCPITTLTGQMSDPGPGFTKRVYILSAADSDATQFGCVRSPCSPQQVARNRLRYDLSTGLVTCHSSPRGCV